MLVSVMAMLAGILLVALPVAIVGSKFQEVYLEMEQEKKEKWYNTLKKRDKMIPITGFYL